MGETSGRGNNRIPLNTTHIILIAVAIVGYGLVSGRAQSWAITPPMVFVAFGFAVSPAGLGLLDFSLESGFVHVLAELTLLIVLFTDASRIDLRRLRREHRLPERLLVVGMPLTALLGTVVAALIFPAAGIWSALILAIILTPTDAALGQAVLTSSRVPVRIRQTLNVESGLNDGIALPLLLIALSLAGATEHPATARELLRFAALQITLGPVVGAVVGYWGGKVVERAIRSGWMNHAFQQLCALGLALLAFGLAELVGGNGFIAAFVGGLVIGNSARDVCTCLYEFGEAEGQLLSLLIFLVFGGLMVPTALAGATWPMVAYALLSLTVIRMVPVAVSLLGTGVRLKTVVFLGWFGPRGIASILFGLLVREESNLPHIAEMFTVLTLTVLLSVYLHGITANPAASAYGHRVERAADAHAEEMTPVSEMPLRIRASTPPHTRLD